MPSPSHRGPIRTERHRVESHRIERRVGLSTRVALIGVMSMASGSMAYAQPEARHPSPGATPKQIPITSLSDGPTKLLLDPFHLESIGLTLYAPVGSHVEATTAGREASAQVIADDGTWVVNVRSHLTANAATTITEVADQMQKEWIDGANVRDEKGNVSPVFANLLLREPKPGQSLTIPNRGAALEAERLYVATRQDVKQAATVRGFTAVKSAANQFVTFELITTESGFAAARAAFETMTAGVELRDPASINADRATAIKAGTRVLSSLTAEDYRVLLAAPERWERIFKPAPSGLDADATEVGYRRLRVQVGPRSLVGGGVGSGGAGSGAGASQSRAVTERQEGYVVTMSARFMNDGRPIDSESTFFMSPDRKDELWLVRLTDRGRSSKPVTMTETGARTDRQMSVKIDAPGSQGKVIQPTFTSPRAAARAAAGEGGSEADLLNAYATRVESALWPQVLLRKQLQAEVGVYAYQSDAEGIRIRRDTLEAVAPGSAAPDGAAWRLTSRLNEDRPPQVSYYDSQGALLRTESPDGTVWQPTTPQRLMDLWRSKGLPVN